MSPATHTHADVSTSNQSKSPFCLFPLFTLPLSPPSSTTTAQRGVLTVGGRCARLRWVAVVMVMMVVVGWVTVVTEMLEIHATA